MCRVVVSSVVLFSLAEMDDPSGWAKDIPRFGVAFHRTPSFDTIPELFVQKAEIKTRILMVCNEWRKQLRNAKIQILMNQKTVPLDVALRNSA